jgi:uncharacterized protein involved in exopolysaccharide biosynthesis
VTSEVVPPESGKELDLFDYALIRNVIGFVFRGVVRNRVLTVATFVTVAVVGLVVTALLPRTWHAEARLLANQNQIIRALGNPRAALPSEDPTRAAREIIFAHDNLVSLIKQTNLLKSWDESRPFVVRVKDKLVALVAGPTSDEDKLDALVGTLEKRLRVDTDQQTVTISADWPDAQTAYLLVDTAQQNFLETRHITEMTAISEALSILEGHAANVQRTVDDALHELERVRERRRAGGSASPQQAPISETGAGATASFTTEPEPKPNAMPAATEQELAQLKFLLNSKRRALKDLEEFRSRREAELTAQLQEQKVQYADQHPVVLDTQNRIEALKQDSPQMTQVKGDIESVLQEYKRKGGRDPDSLIEPVQPRSVPQRRTQQTQVALSSSELQDDPLVEFSRNNLRVAAAKYEELMMRIDGARIEQDTARVAFKYRYSVVRPAAVPKKPTKPDAAILSVVALVAALFVSLLAGAVREWFRGSLVEAWQVERLLKVKVLSQVRLH